MHTDGLIVDYIFTSGDKGWPCVQRWVDLGIHWVVTCTEITTYYVVA
jgi:hypothetical protein